MVVNSFSIVHHLANHPYITFSSSFLMTRTTFPFLSSGIPFQPKPAQAPPFRQRHQHQRNQAPAKFEPSAVQVAVPATVSVIILPPQRSAPRRKGLPAPRERTYLFYRPSPQLPTTLFASSFQSPRSISTHHPRPGESTIRTFFTPFPRPRFQEFQGFKVLRALRLQRWFSRLHAPAAPTFYHWCGFGVLARRR